MPTDTNISITDKIKTLIKNKMVHFMYYHDGNLWYMTDDDFEFPVPITQCGSAIYLHQDKAIYFMRYIRKHLETLEQVQKSQNDDGKGETNDTLKNSL